MHYSQQRSSPCSHPKSTHNQTRQRDCPSPRTRPCRPNRQRRAQRCLTRRHRQICLSQMRLRLTHRPTRSRVAQRRHSMRHRSNAGVRAPRPHRLHRQLMTRQLRLRRLSCLTVLASTLTRMAGPSARHCVIQRCVGTCQSAELKGWRAESSVLLASNLGVESELGSST